MVAMAMGVKNQTDVSLRLLCHLHDTGSIAAGVDDGGIMTLLIKEKITIHSERSD
jgi:hypothetical protein